MHIHKLSSPGAISSHGYKYFHSTVAKVEGIIHNYKATISQGWYQQIVVVLNQLLEMPETN